MGVGNDNSQLWQYLSAMTVQLWQ